MLDPPTRDAENTAQMHERSFERLGKAVADRRKALGLKQVELGELARCSTRFVHMVEAGKASVRLDKLLDLLSVLGLGLQVARRKHLDVPDNLVGGRE